MLLHRDHRCLPVEAKGCVVAMGSFDGVHLGHQAVVAEARSLAADLGCGTGVVTFEPHPRRFFAPDAPRFELTPLRSKARHLGHAGVDHIYALRFDSDLAAMSADAFIEDVLVASLAVRGVVIGWDFRFGVGRTGDAALLQAAARRHGFEVRVVRPRQGPHGEIYSSSLIRRYLQDGQPEQAASLLGRCWGMHGIVVPGAGSAGKAGVLTANILTDEYIWPKAGTYAVWAGVERGRGIDWHKGVSLITANDGTGGLSFASHLAGFRGDLTGQRLWVALVRFLWESSASRADDHKTMAHARRDAIASIDRTVEPGRTPPKTRLHAGCGIAPAGR